MFNLQKHIFLIAPCRIGRFGIAVVRGFSWRYPLQYYRAHGQWSSWELFGVRIYIYDQTSLWDLIAEETNHERDSRP